DDLHHGILRNLAAQERGGQVWPEVPGLEAADLRVWVETVLRSPADPVEGRGLFTDHPRCPAQHLVVRLAPVGANTKVLDADDAQQVNDVVDDRIESRPASEKTRSGAVAIAVWRQNER